ncbi:MAG: UbiD family decarboxylase, partial [Nonomuraea sp.]|nr:UbiD family decarboxylase [Nonomuraea sp.]
GSRFLPPGVTKTALAGALAGAPLALDGGAIAGAEIVIEGVLGEERADETVTGKLGASLPEFLGYDGSARACLPVVTVTRVTTRPDPIYQAVIGPGREQSVILGLAGALSVALSVPDPLIADLHFSPAGGGMLLLAAALRKRRAADDTRLAALAEQIFRGHPFTKLIVFVDDDVDAGCAEDVWWAVTTRCNLGVDAVTRDGFEPLGMDPSQGPGWPRGGGAGRTFVDATVPYAHRASARRSYR